MAEPTSVLVIEDDEGTREAFRHALVRAGFEVTDVGSAAEATECLRQKTFSAAVVDIYLPDGRGLSLIRTIQESNPNCVVIIVTGYASLDTALAALRAGAYEYLCKPFSGDELVRAVRRALERRQLIAANMQMASELADASVPSSQQSRARRQVAALGELAATIARTHSTPATLSRICQTAAELAGGDVVAILEPHLPSRTLTVIVAFPPDDLLPGASLPVSSFLSQACSGVAVSAPDILF
ncbi:MAG: response regulator, partial [Armatimonadetes bacterium]|nr:response regulator [Armatimonadota bacterium]